MEKKYGRVLITLSGAVVAAGVIFLFFSMATRLVNKNTSSEKFQGSLIRVTENPHRIIAKENQEEEKFDKPIPVVWRASVLGCLESCAGYSFKNLDPKAKYPYFQGHDYIVGGENLIPDDMTFEVSGEWTGIDCAYQNTVFDGHCTPSVEITKMEEFPKLITERFSEERVEVGGAAYMFIDLGSAGNASENVSFSLWDFGTGLKSYDFYADYNFRKDSFYEGPCDIPKYSDGADKGEIGTFFKNKIVKFWQENTDWPKSCLGI